MTEPPDPFDGRMKAAAFYAHFLEAFDAKALGLEHRVGALAVGLTTPKVLARRTVQLLNATVGSAVASTRAAADPGKRSDGA